MRKRLNSLSELPKKEKFFAITGRNESQVETCDYYYYHATKGFFSFFINEKTLTILKKRGKMVEKDV